MNIQKCKICEKPFVTPGNGTDKYYDPSCCKDCNQKAVENS